jgi:hypothetical protein
MGRGWFRFAKFLLAASVIASGTVPASALIAETECESITDRVHDGNASRWVQYAQESGGLAYWYDDHSNTPRDGEGHTEVGFKVYKLEQWYSVEAECPEDDD